MAICPLCNKTKLITANDQELQACGPCAGMVGIIPLPPTRRPQAACMRCNGRQFMRVIPREHTSIVGRDLNKQVSAPMYVTHHATPRRGFFQPDPVVPTHEPGYGLLETWICRKCGFVEWYCFDVEKIPAHPHLMSELVDFDTTGPYR